MPTVVHTTIRGYVYAPFRCEHCRHEDLGAVYMRASASAQVSLLQDRDESRDLSMGTAHGNMEQSGDALIALSPCPNCGLRDELAVKTHYDKAKPWLFGGAGFLLFGLAGVGYLASKDQLEMGMFATGPVVLIGLVAVIVGLVKRLRPLPKPAIFRSVDPRVFSPPRAT